MWPWPRGKYQTSPGSKSFVSAFPCGSMTVVRTRPSIDERPLGRGGVPVQLAHGARLELHRDAGDPLGDRQLLDGRLLAGAAADRPCPADFSSSNLKVGSSSPASSGSGTLFMKLGSPASAGFVRHQRRGRRGGEPRGRRQEFTSLPNPT